MKQLFLMGATTLMASTPALAMSPREAAYADGLLHGAIIQNCLLHEHGHLNAEFTGRLNQNLMRDVARADRFALMEEMPNCPFIN